MATLVTVVDVHGGLPIARGAAPPPRPSAMDELPGRNARASRAQRADAPSDATISVYRAQSLVE